MSAYPTGYDAFTNPAGSDPLNTSGAKLHSTQHGQVNDAIEAIEVELGLSPSGSEATVAARLTAIEGSIGGGGGGGIVLVDSGTFSAAASFSLPNGTFDTTYDDYIVMVRAVGSTNILATGKLRLSGTDSSTGYDTTRAINYSNTGSVSTNGAGTDEFHAFGCGSSAPGAMTLTLFSPAIAEYTSIDLHASFYYNTTGYGAWITAGVHAVATAYDSMTFIADTGNMTGRWAVYGYAK
jgi:hypothetical protein